MPKKYHVNVQSLPPRYEPISEFCSIEVNKCLQCNRCVKYAACVYNIYRKRGFDCSQVLDTGDYQCANCLRCVQECKANILTRVKNERYDVLGDDYWKPALIEQIWRQAETGKIPVSGAGYRGPFCGFGFDQMWTDMSEIVRPTRDGIHGREYISTVIELGRRPEKLEFDEKGNLLTDFPHFVELPIPIILDIPSIGIMSESVRNAIVKAAVGIGTLAVADYEEAQELLAENQKNLVVKFDPHKHSMSSLVGVPIVELAYSEDVMDIVTKVKDQNPDIITSIRLPLDMHAAKRATNLAKIGSEVLHLQASAKGRGMGKCEHDFVTELVREVHLQLVDNRVRDQVTVLVSGGIAMAEHVAKIIICGVDGVGIDLATMVALECRLCKDCNDNIQCPIHLDKVPVEYGAQRIINLIGSWHSQLIEVMGAMGIREIRRLRGEVGRAMFFSDLEKDNFTPIFGERNGTAGFAEDLNQYTDLGTLAVNKPTHIEVPEQWTFPLARGLVNMCNSRYRNRLSKYKVVRTSACVSCGKCTEICRFGVHQRSGKRILSPQSYRCSGPDLCGENDALCVEVCPQGALCVGRDPLWETFGDFRWTPDLIVSTWIQAETGRPPENGLEYRVGASGGGLDKIDFIFPEKLIDTHLKPKDIDLSISLNRRTDDNRPKVEIGFPIYGGGMSFGAISLFSIIARAQAYKTFNSFTCTGEGGYPDELIPYQEHVITQVATGLFGVREETIQRSRVVEFKYAQGAKPGLGGHLLGDKVTPSVAKIRESVEGNALFSPFPFHSVYSVEDHKKHVDWIKLINPEAIVSVKVSSPTDVDMVAVGSYYAGAHIIHIDGSYGGTGAAPDIAKKNIAMPIEYAIPKVHKFLIEEGIRDQMTLIASGGIRTAWDIAKIIALGADGVVIATSEMVALECIRCGRCESGRGCPRGLATTDPELSTSYSVKWATQRLINLFHSYSIQLQEILWRFGMKHVRELVGRSDLLIHRDYTRQTE
ncbi:MAG: glutamate synthase-related protein [Thermodesulfobacteriota bacterium]|nr:glutamate synthase-related protein [Thermodesulfobacteriota bacterium]